MVLLYIQQSIQGSAEDVGKRRLAKRKKWQLKWQAKRQKRKETQNRMSENTQNSDSKSNEEQSPAKRTSSHVRKSETTASPAEEELRPSRKRPRGNNIGEQSHVAKRSKHRHVAGRHSHGDEEETRFTEMISKYRLKMERLL